MYSAVGVRAARIIPKWVRNSSWTSRSGARSRPYARSLTLITAIVMSPFGLWLEPGGHRSTAVIVPEIGGVVLQGAVVCQIIGTRLSRAAPGRPGPRTYPTAAP